MTQIKEKTGICKSVVIATLVAIPGVVKNGFHCNCFCTLATNMGFKKSIQDKNKWSKNVPL